MPGSRVQDDPRDRESAAGVDSSDESDDSGPPAPPPEMEPEAKKPQRRGSLGALKDKLKNIGKSTSVKEMNAEARPNLPRSSSGGQAFFGAAVATALAVKTGTKWKAKGTAKRPGEGKGAEGAGKQAPAGSPNLAQHKGAIRKQRSMVDKAIESAGTMAKTRLYRLVESLAPGAGFMIEKDVSLNEQKIQLNDVMAFLAIVGICVAIADVELYPGGARELGSIVLRSIVSLTCLLMCLILLRLYRARLTQMKLKNRFLVHETMLSTGLVPHLLGEMLLVCAHLPPLVRFHFTPLVAFYGADAPEREYAQDESALALLTFLRCYLFMKVARDHSVVFRGHGRALSRANGIAPDFSLAMRAYIALYPLRTLAFGFTAILSVSSYALLVFERAYNSDYGFGTSLWNLVIAMTTVGFGDVYPETYPGRVVVATAVLFGLVLTSTATTVMIDKARLHPGEERIVRTMKGAMIMTNYRVAAARCIQAIFRWHDRKLERDRALAKAGRPPETKRMGFDAVELRALAHWQESRKRKQKWDEYCDSIQALENMKDGAIRSVEEKLDALCRSHAAALRVVQSQAEQATARAAKAEQTHSVADVARAASLSKEVAGLREEVAAVAARQAALSDQAVETSRLLQLLCRSLSSVPHLWPKVEGPMGGPPGRPRALPSIVPSPSPPVEDTERSGRKPFRARSRRRGSDTSESLRQSAASSAAAFSP